MIYKFRVWVNIYEIGKLLIFDHEINEKHFQINKLLSINQFKRWTDKRRILKFQVIKKVLSKLKPVTYVSINLKVYPALWALGYVVVWDKENECFNLRFAKHTQFFKWPQRVRTWLKL